MVYAPLWLVQEFLEQVVRGDYPLLSVGHYPPFATCCMAPSLPPILVRSSGHRFHRPSICPKGQGLVWQPSETTLGRPVLTPLPSPFIETFVRQRVLIKLPSEMVNHVMSFLEDVHHVTVGLDGWYSQATSSDDDKDEEESEIHEPPVVETNTFRVFNVQDTLHQNKTYHTFHTTEDANSYFDRHGIKGKTAQEISQDLDDAIACFESMYRPQPAIQ